MNTLQSVEERKKYQLVEQFLLYSQEWSNWLTNSSTHLEEHETFKNQIKRQLNDLREKVQIFEFTNFRFFKLFFTPQKDGRPIL